jgi:hypothetical protein
MIGYFPEPYPDEIFYSICARYHDILGFAFATESALPMSLFGVNKISGLIFTPYRLTYFISQLPFGHHYTIQRIINNHTVLPYYRPFTPSERMENIYQRLKADTWRNVAGIEGPAHAYTRTPFLRYCVQCVKEDAASYDVAYWHREHQLPGVVICPKHLNLLSQSDIPTHGDPNPKIISLNTYLSSVNGEETVQYTGIHYQSLINIAQSTQWLLQQSKFIFENEPMIGRYRNLLWQKGYASYHGLIYVEKLMRDLKSHYSDEFLQSLGCQIDEQVRNWVSILFQNVTRNRYKSPLQHLLIMEFLGITAEEFFHSPAAKYPFGTGPWPCLNPICKMYKHFNIIDIEFNYSTRDGKPIGVFECDECGYTYGRKGPDKNKKDVFRKTEVIKYGHFWEAKFRELWTDPLCAINEIKIAFVLNHRGVLREAKRLGLGNRPEKVDSRLLNLVRQNCPNDFKITGHTLLQACQIAWHALIKKHSSMSPMEFYQRFRVLCHWLLVYDPKWLAENVFKPVVTSMPKTLDEWKNLDIQLSEQVESIAAEIKANDTEPPIRLTKTHILNKTHYSYLVRHLSKLPKTDQKLKEFCETLEDFAVRRIIWVTNRYISNGVVLTRSKLINTARINPSHQKYIQVQHALEEAVRLFEAASSNK